MCNKLFGGGKNVRGERVLLHLLKRETSEKRKESEENEKYRYSVMSLNVQNDVLEFLNIY